MPAFLTGILGFSRRDNHPDGIGAPYLPSGFCFAFARTLEDVRESRKEKSKTNMSLRHSSMALFICTGEERDGNPHSLTMAINDPGQNG
jgi:hypothetical protein